MMAEGRNTGSKKNLLTGCSGRGRLWEGTWSTSNMTEINASGFPCIKKDNLFISSVFTWRVSGSRRFRVVAFISSGLWEHFRCVSLYVEEGAPFQDTFIEGFVVRAMPGDERAHGDKYLYGGSWSSCQRCHGVHFSWRWIFAFVSGAIHRHISSQKLTAFLGSQSGTVAAGRSFRTGGSLAFCENKKKCFLNFCDFFFSIWKKLTLGAFVIFKGFETTCLAYLHSRKFTLQAKLEKCQAAPLGFEPGTFCLPGRFSSWEHIFPFCRMETTLRTTNCSVGKDLQSKW